MHTATTPTRPPASSTKRSSASSARRRTAPARCSASTAPGLDARGPGAARARDARRRRGRAPRRRRDGPQGRRVPQGPQGRRHDHGGQGADLWSRVQHVLLPKDYVRLRLSGEYAIDVADASGTLLLDVARRRMVDGDARGRGIAASCCPTCSSRRRSARACRADAAARDGPACRHADRRRRRRSGRGRGRHGHHAARCGQRHDRHVGRRVRRDGSAGARSAGADAHLLSRGAGSLARDGRDAGRGPVAAMVARSVGCAAGRCRLRRADGRSRRASRRAPTASCGRHI